MKDKTTVGKFIHQKRLEAGLSQKELAEKLYVTESAVSKWERGVSYPDITMISGICEILNISEHELCIAGEDSGQRMTALMAEKYVRIRLIYNIITALCYISALIPCFIVFVLKEHSLSKFCILLTSLMLAASLLNVPILAKKHRCLITLGSFFASLELLLLSGCIYSGGDWFVMAFISTLMGICIIFFPFIVRSSFIAPYIGNNKALVCMAADSLLIMADVIYGVLKYGSRHDLSVGIFSVLWCLALAWIIFAAIRYIRINAALKASIGLAAAAVWILLTQPVLRTVIDGSGFYLNFCGNDTANTAAAAVTGIAAVIAAASGIIVALRQNRD